MVLKASVARNYRYPTLNDRYYQPGGNPDLRPEHGFTYDGGISFALGGEAEGYTLRGEATLFDSHIDDWILWVQARRGYWTPRNVRKVHNYGAETKVDASVRLSPDWRTPPTANSWSTSPNTPRPPRRRWAGAAGRSSTNGTITANAIPPRATTRRSAPAGSNPTT